MTVRAQIFFREICAFVMVIFTKNSAMANLLLTIDCLYDKLNKVPQPRFREYARTGIFTFPLL